MSTQRRLELHPFVPYVDASHICKHCDGGEYAACHDTKEQPMIGKSKTEFDMRLGEFMKRFDHKEQPMSDTLQEGEDQKVWLKCCQGYTHAPWCPAYEEAISCQRCKGIATTTVNTRHFGIEKLCEPCAVNVRRDGQEVVTRHEPAARGGGEEWRVVEIGQNTYIERDTDEPFICDMQTYDSSDAERKEARQLANQIVDEHRQHQSLVAERERLRSKLEEVRSTLGGLRNHLRSTEDSRAKDYIRFMFEQVDAALNQQRSTSE